MDWRPLAEYPEEHLWRGTVLRLLVSEWPYERPVDFMLVSAPGAPCGLAVVVSSGYKAGNVLVQLPAEARVEPGAISVSRSWLVENWTEWMGPECPVEEVRVSRGYPPGVGG